METIVRRAGTTRAAVAAATGAGRAGPEGVPGARGVATATANGVP